MTFWDGESLALAPGTQPDTTEPGTAEASQAVGGTAIIMPSAEIDLTNAEPLQHELNAALDRGITTLVVDMSKTTFCDSAGAATLFRAHKRAAAMKADLRLVIGEPTVRRIFEITGMDEIMQIYASLDAAKNLVADAVPDPPGL